MHIGVDATCWHNQRGYGRHGRALLRALVQSDERNHYRFFLDAPANGESLPPKAEVELVTASAPAAVAAAANGHRSLGDMWRMSRAMSKADLDVLLFPTVYSFVPVLSRAKKVVILHDVIAEKFPQHTMPSRMGRWFWKTKVALARWQADALVTVSEHSRQGLMEHFRLTQEKIHVVGEASDPVFRVLENPQPTPRMLDWGLTGAGRTVIYVGGFGPHKNLDMLMRVFASVAHRLEFADVRLVMVGEYAKEVFHSDYATLKTHVDAQGLGARVLFTGFVPDEELVVLLNRATVLVLPSLLEGFGLPAVEAAACGCPVIATTASPLPGLLGEGGLFVDPADQAGWEQAVMNVLKSESLRQRLRSAALDAARKLTWDAAATQLLQVLQKVATA